VNAYEVKAGIGVIAGKTVGSMPERLRVLQKCAPYKYTYVYILPRRLSIRKYAMNDQVSTIWGCDRRFGVCVCAVCVCAFQRKHKTA